MSLFCQEKPPRWAGVCDGSFEGGKRVLVQSALLKASETLFQSTTSHHAVR